jgi:hypothetical protein
MGAVAVGGFVVGGCRRLKRAGDGRWVVARRFAEKEVGGRYGGGQRQAEEVEQKTFSGRYAVYIYIYGTVARPGQGKNQPRSFCDIIHSLIS